MVKPPIQTPPAQDLFDPMGALEVTREAQRAAKDLWGPNFGWSARFI